MDNICKEFHKGLNAFDLRVLEQPSPTIDLFSLQDKLGTLRADVDAILATPRIVQQVAPFTLSDDTVFEELLSDDYERARPQIKQAKRKKHRSSPKHVLIDQEQTATKKRQLEKESER